MSGQSKMDMTVNSSEEPLKHKWRIALNFSEEYESQIGVQKKHSQEML